MHLFEFKLIVYNLMKLIWINKNKNWMIEKKLNFM
jgi:hypothetical protein